MLIFLAWSYMRFCVSPERTSQSEFHHSIPISNYCKSSHFREGLYKSSLKIQMKNIMIQGSCLSDSLGSHVYAVFLSNFSCYFSLETTHFHQQPLWYPSNDFYPQGVLKIKFVKHSRNTDYDTFRDYWPRYNYEDKEIVRDCYAHYLAFNNWWSF